MTMVVLRNKNQFLGFTKVIRSDKHGGHTAGHVFQIGQDDKHPTNIRCDTSKRPDLLQNNYIHLLCMQLAVNQPVNFWETGLSVCFGEEQC